MSLGSSILVGAFAIGFAAALWLGCARSVPPTPVPAKGAPVSGRAVDEGGRPIGGAQLRREWTNDSCGHFALDPHRALLAMSAADGSFTLDALALGRTSIEVRAPGFATEHRELFADAYVLPEWRVVLARSAPISGRVVGAPPGLSLEIGFWENHKPFDVESFVKCATDGSFVIDGLAPDHGQIDATAVLAQSHEELSAAVFVHPGETDVELPVSPPHSCRLQVVDAATDAPLAGARFDLHRWSDIVATAQKRVSVDAPGTYALSFLAPPLDDSCALAVTCDGHEGVLLGRLPPVPDGTSEPERVRLKALEATALRVLDDPSAAPIAGAHVHAEVEELDDRFGPRPAQSALPASFDGTSDADGRVRALLSSQQRYRITVEHADHAPLELALDVGAHPPPELELRLAHGGSIAVLCLDATTHAPLAGQEIECALDQAEERWRGPMRAETGPDGRVRFEHVPAAFRRVSFPFGAEDRAQRVSVIDGFETAVVLERPLVRLHGTVSEHGRALAGAIVTALEQGEATTDIDGHYELDELDPGDVQFAITHPKYRLVHLQELELVPPEMRLDVDLELTELSAVVSEAQGTPVAHAFASIAELRPDGFDTLLQPRGLDSGLDDYGETDADGHVLFGIPPRKGLFLVLEKSGFVTEHVPLEFPDGATRIELAPVLRSAATEPGAKRDR